MLQDLRHGRGEPPTAAEFCRSMRGINDGEDLEECYLAYLHGKWLEIVEDHLKQQERERREWDVPASADRSPEKHSCCIS